MAIHPSPTPIANYSRGPHASIPARHHAVDRVGTALSGTWQFGYGKKLDPSKLKTLPVGSIYTEPANAPHFAETGDEAVTMLITGIGPTDTIHENPADDPATKHQACSIEFAAHEAQVKNLER